MTTCVDCRKPTDQPVYCGCESVFCPTCMTFHGCDREHLARWSGAPDREPVEAVIDDPPIDEPSIEETIEVPRIETIANVNGAITSPVKPRDYQIEAINAIKTELETNGSTLLVAATGLGKTVAFASIINDWPLGRIMVAAHREELIMQAANQIERVTGESVDIEMADLRADSATMYQRARTVVTSVQTQNSGNGHLRMEKFDPFEFGLLIVDEAHHATSATYRRMIDHYRQNPNLKVLGVTATPDRTDEEALGQIFESVAYEFDILDGIEGGWLVPIQQQFVFVEDLDFSDVKTTAGDLNAGQLDRIMRDEAILHRVVDPLVGLAGDEPTLVFATSIAHAEKMAEIANRHRPDCAAWVCGRTDKDIRRTTLQRFKRREFQFLFNVGCFTEGFDEPQIGCVAIARPTKSRSLYAQMIGRGTRTLDGAVDGIATAGDRRQRIATSGKPSLLVLDFVGVSGKHKLISTGDILGGKCSDDIVERAKQQARRKSADGFQADMIEELAEARRIVAEEEARRRKHVIGKAKFGSKSVNPFDVYDLSPSREPGWHKGRKPSPKMTAMLERNGVETEGLTFSNAKQLIGEIIDRRERGLCSFKQAKLLRKYGESADVSFDEAKVKIDAIANNNWKPLR